MAYTITSSLSKEQLATTATPASTSGEEASMCSPGLEEIARARLIRLKRIYNFFDAPCLFYTICFMFCLHFVAFLCDFQN
jgi:hypothetical protein